MRLCCVHCGFLQTIQPQIKKLRQPKSADFSVYTNGICAINVCVNSMYQEWCVQRCHDESTENHICVNAQQNITKECIYKINNLKPMFTVHLNSNKGDVINCYGIVLLCDMLILLVFFTTQCVSVCTSYTSFFIIQKPFANLMNHCISSFSRPLIPALTYYTTCCIHRIGTFMLILFWEFKLKT